MADYIKKLTDAKTADGILPRSVSSAITMTTGTGTVDTRITDIEIGKISMLSDDTSPALGGSLNVGENNIYFSERNNGDSGTSKNIDWTKSHKQKITLTADATLTFTNPVGPCNLILRIVQDDPGGRSLTLPTIKWPGGSYPVFSTAVGSVDLLSLYYDGVDYYGQVGMNFL